MPISESQVEKLARRGGRGDNTNYENKKPRPKPFAATVGLSTCLYCLDICPGGKVVVEKTRSWSGAGRGRRGGEGRRVLISNLSCIRLGKIRSQRKKGEKRAHKFQKGCSSNNFVFSETCIDVL